jgi:hypothetical protein
MFLVHLPTLSSGYLFSIENVQCISMSLDSVVSVAVGYRMDDQRVVVEVLVRSRIFTSPNHPDQLRDGTNLLSIG